MTTNDYPVVCFFDGACEPKNPGGNMGIGAIIFHEGKEVARCANFVKEDISNSCNVAEYMALHWVLTTLVLLELNHKVKIIRGDSQMVINQMKGEWKIKGGRYSEYAYLCQIHFTENFTNTKFQWIPRHENYFADELSKKAFRENNVQQKIQPGQK